MTIGCDSSTPLTSRFDIQVMTPNSTIFDALFDQSTLIDQSNPLDSVDRQSVVDLTNALNIFLGSVDLTPYPILGNRFGQFPITYVETADFVLANQTNISTLYPAIRDYNSGVMMPVIISSFLSDFDFHLDANIGNTISAGLCGQFGNIFQKLLGLFTLIDTAKGLIDDIKNLAEKDPLKKAKALTLQQIIVALKNAIVQIVKKLVKKVRDQITAMVNTVVATITDIAGSAQRLYAKLKKMADDIVEFFKEGSVKQFLERIEKFISSTAAQFERLTIENVALLMFRFCQFTELLQALLMGPAKALTALAQTIAIESLIAKNSSLKETKAAVDAGATRVPSQTRTELKDDAIKNTNTSSLPEAEVPIVGVIVAPVVIDTPLPPVIVGGAPVVIDTPTPLPPVIVGGVIVTPVVIDTPLPPVIVGGAPVVIDTPTPLPPVIVAPLPPVIVAPLPPVISTPQVQAPIAPVKPVKPAKPADASKPSTSDYQTPRDATSAELKLINTITDAGLPGKFTFAPLVVKNKNWQKVKPAVWVRLLRICELTGIKFVVNSGYRDATYNKSVGGAFDSVHGSGQAIDIAVSRRNRDAVFLAAQKAGFTGIGIYSTFMHLDTGTRRMWVAGYGAEKGNAYSLTKPEIEKWSKIIPKHNADLYRKNSGAQQ